MENWQDQGIVLAVRPHGEHGGIVSLLTPEHGRCAGYVRGARGSRMRGTLEVGNIVDVGWRSRVSEGLGAFTLELVRNHAARHMQDPLRLAALQSACGLCDAAFPERVGGAALYSGLSVFLDILESDVWAGAYVMWEVALLKELGFALDLTRCAGGRDDLDLAYVSPKSGRAVSAEAGAPYKDKLLLLARFLSPQGGGGGDADVLVGLNMLGYFLTHWVFAQDSRGVPALRLLFAERFATSVADLALKEDKHGAG